MIVGVAVRNSDGSIYSLPKPARHCHLSKAYNDSSRESGWDIPWEGWEGRVLAGEQGFITDTGAFLDREAAAAHAYRCRQIAKRKRELFSEDVW